MQVPDNIISFSHLYGINNGMFVAASVFTFLFAISFVFQKNHRSFCLLFMLASVGYLFFCTFNLYFQHFHFSSLASRTYPEALLFIGKVTPPLALTIFTYLFVSETVMRSKKAYDFIERNKWTLTALYTINTISFITLIFLANDKWPVLLVYALMTLHLAFGAVYAFKGLGRSTIGKVITVLFSISAIEYVVIMALIFKGFDSIPKSVIFTGHFFLSFVAVVFSFAGIRFGYDQITKFSGASRGQSRQLMGHINKAVKNGEFFLVYQPKLDIHDNKICGVEALIRWKHPKLGFVRPDEFIPLAETTHMIDTICEWVIEAAAKQAKSFNDDGYQIPISINFSVKNLQPKIVNFLFDTMKKYELEADDLMIEVTETVFMENNEPEQKALAMLHSQNIPLSLDDYGTGFSSLSSINQLALSEIKIDREFVSDLVENHEHHIIVRSTLRMSKELGVRVVAEGVEELDMIATLKDMHCDAVQGYGIAKPMIAADFIRWLRKSDYHYIRHQTLPVRTQHSINL